MVRLMNGKYERGFNANVTHLIANETGSDKYRFSVRLKKKIVKEQWVCTYK